MIGLAYYLRVAALPFLGATESEPANPVPADAAPRRLPGGVLAALAIATAAVAVFSIYPQPLLHAADNSGVFSATFPGR